MHSNKRTGGMKPPVLLYRENPALNAGFNKRYAFDQKSSRT